MNNKILVSYLNSLNPKNAGFVDKIKISYRPYVCPFIDLLDIIPTNSSVFDVGCGSGMFLSLVQKFRSPQKLGGIEISKELITNAREILMDKQSDVDLAVFDGKNIPETIREYNYIVMIDVYHHIPLEQQKVFMDSLISKMSSGTYLIFKDIEGASFLSYWNKMHDLLLSGEVGNEPTSEEMKTYFEGKKGLTIKSFSKKRMLLYPHFTYIIQKV